MRLALVARRAWYSYTPAQRRWAEGAVYSFLAAALPVIWDRWAHGHIDKAAMVLAVGEGFGALGLYLRQGPRKPWSMKQRIAHKRVELEAGVHLHGPQQ